MSGTPDDLVASLTADERAALAAVADRLIPAAHDMPSAADVLTDDRLRFVLAARPETYVEGLVGFRAGRMADWIVSFAAASKLAAAASVNLAERVAALQAGWFEQAGRPRAGSAAARLIALLPALPVLSAPTARVAIGVSQQQTLVALKELATAGVLRQISLKLAMPSIMSTGLFVFMIAWNEFLFALLFLVDHRERWTVSLGLSQLSGSVEIPTTVLMAGSVVLLKNEG